jgi:hypothetical protein
VSQLDCLLRSIDKYWQLYNLDIHVISKWSNSRFHEGYDKLYNVYPKIHFWYETIFDYNIDLCINYYNHEVVGFMTDDCVMFDYPALRVCNLEEAIKDKLCFSLRLGENTIIQNYQNGDLQRELNGTTDGDVVDWKWKRHSPYTNYGYMFSWDGHFYHKEWLLKALENRKFENPRAGEHQLNTDKLLRDISPDSMVCCSKSSLFVNTVNCVQEAGPAAGTKHFYSPEELNEKFLVGERISLSSFDGLSIMSCHEEVPLTFERF